MTKLDDFKDDFDALCTAAKLDTVSLFECTDAKTGEVRAAICIVVETPEGIFNVLPVAVMEKDLVDKLIPPASPDATELKPEEPL